MPVHLESYPALLVLGIAVIAPLLAEIPIGVRVPALVLEIVLGIVVGPHVLGLAGVSPLLGWLGGSLGLAALFFMAGLELDLAQVRGRPISLAARGWLLSLVLGIVLAALLHALPFVEAPMMASLALATTAMGVLLPILRDAGELDTNFGRLVLAAGSIGEFGPIVLMSLVFTQTYRSWVESASWSSSWASPSGRTSSASIRSRFTAFIKVPKLLLNDNNAGKPEGIHLMIGRRPSAAFGNSGGDRQMLEYTKAGLGARLEMLVLHDDASREYAYGPA